MMYLFLALLFPILLVFSPQFALAALVAAIVWMVIARTRPPAMPPRQRSDEPKYEPGYK